MRTLVILVLLCSFANAETVLYVGENEVLTISAAGPVTITKVKADRIVMNRDGDTPDDPPAGDLAARTAVRAKLVNEPATADAFQKIFAFAAARVTEGSRTYAEALADVQTMTSIALSMPGATNKKQQWQVAIATTLADIETEPKTAATLSAVSAGFADAARTPAAVGQAQPAFNWLGLLKCLFEEWGNAEEEIKAPITPTQGKVLQRINAPVDVSFTHWLRQHEQIRQKGKAR